MGNPLEEFLIKIYKIKLTLTIQLFIFQSMSIKPKLLIKLIKNNIKSLVFWFFSIKCLWALNTLCKAQQDKA